MVEVIVRARTNERLDVQIVYGAFFDRISTLLPTTIINNLVATYDWN